MQQSFVGYDPFSKELKIIGLPPAITDLNKYFMKVIGDITNARKAAGIKEWGIIPVVNRTTGEMRWFDVIDSNTGNYTSTYLVYGEALFNKVWYVPTVEEEKVIVAKDEEKRLAAIKAVEEDKQQQKIAELSKVAEVVDAVVTQHEKKKGKM